MTGTTISHAGDASGRARYEPIPTAAELAEIGRRVGTDVIWERRIVGGQSATTDVLRRCDDGTGLALRRHGRWTIGVDDDSARREHLLFDAVRARGIPVPRVLWSGPFGPTTAIITELVDGEVVVTPSAPMAWADTLAETLALVHDIDLDDELATILHQTPPDPDVARVDDLLRTHPDGRRLLAACFDLLPGRSIERTLVHGDYWPGNVLWRDGSIVALLDWERAVIGDPARDVAYCATELQLLGHREASDRFVETYRTSTGRRLPTLPYWTVSTLCNAMVDLPAYVDSWRGFGHEADPADLRARLHRLIGEY